MLHRPLISNASTSVISRDKKLNEKKKWKKQLAYLKNAKKKYCILATMHLVYKQWVQIGMEVSDMKRIFFEKTYYTEITRLKNSGCF